MCNTLLLCLDMKQNTLKYIGPITWARVFAAWRRAEAWQKCWQEHWRERGFDSWEAWRSNYIASLTPETREWQLYQLTDLAMIVDMYGAPTKGWIKHYYDGALTRPLREVAPMIAQKKNAKVLAIMDDFPPATLLTAVRDEHDRIILVEGMHRTCALTLLVQRDTLPSAIVTLAIADVRSDEIVPLGKGDG